MPKEQFSNNFNKEEKTLGKESLQEKYVRLKQELAELNKSLNEQQKDFSGENVPNADFYAAHALADHKIKRLKEIEAQLREK